MSDTDAALLIVDDIEDNRFALADGSPARAM
jgi:hypothetical protein